MITMVLEREANLQPGQEKEKVKAALLKEVPKEKDTKDADKDDAKKEDGKDTTACFLLFHWSQKLLEKPLLSFPSHVFSIAEPSMLSRSTAESVMLQDKKDTRWISAFVEARPSEDYPAHWFFEDVQFLVSLINFQELRRSAVVQWFTRGSNLC